MRLAKVFFTQSLCFQPIDPGLWNITRVNWRQAEPIIGTHIVSQCDDEYMNEIIYIWTAEMEWNEYMIIAVVNAIFKPEKNSGFNGIWTHDPLFHSF